MEERERERSRTKEGVQNLHGSHCLRPLGPLPNARVDGAGPVLDAQADCADEDDGPGGGRDGIVEDEVALFSGRRGWWCGALLLPPWHGG